jgi:hypothetical protein
MSFHSDQATEGVAFSFDWDVPSSGGDFTLGDPNGQNVRLPCLFEVGRIATKDPNTAARDQGHWLQFNGRVSTLNPNRQRLEIHR